MKAWVSGFFLMESDFFLLLRRFGRERVWNLVEVDFLGFFSVVGNRLQLKSWRPKLKFSFFNKPTNGLPHQPYSPPTFPAKKTLQKPSNNLERKTFSKHLKPHKYKRKSSIFRAKMFQIVLKQVQTHKKTFFY